MAEDSHLPADSSSPVPLENSLLDRPIGDLLTQLDARIASLRQREAHHAEQAVFHQEEQGRFAAELAELTAHQEALRTAASAAVRLTREEAVPVPLMTVSLPATGQRPPVRKLVLQAVGRQPAGESFSPSFLARFLNRSLYGTAHAPVTTSQVSTVLRRLVQDGRLRLVQAGRPHREALYARV